MQRCDKLVLPTRRTALAALGTALAASAIAKPNAFQTVGWDVLVPPGWNPLAGLHELQGDLDQLQDTDPRAKALMEKLRKALNNAPVVEQLNGKQIRLPGYVVPLEGSRQGLHTFLLVPYFGACIHSPPPPSNQIVMCTPDKPIEGLRSMAAVWASGRLDVTRASSEMGVAGYRLAVAAVEQQ